MIGHCENSVLFFCINLGFENGFKLCICCNGGKGRGGGSSSNDELAVTILTIAPTTAESESATQPELQLETGESIPVIRI